MVTLFLFFGLASVASARDLQVGLGAYDVMSNDGGVDGVRALARVSVGIWAFEGAVSYGFQDPAGDGFGRAIVAVVGETRSGGDFQYPLGIDQFAVEGLADLRFVDTAGARWHGGPHLLGGLELARVNRYYLTHDASAADAVLVRDEGSNLRPGLLLGLAVDAWYHGVVGVRFAWLNHSRFDTTPSYSQAVTETGIALVHEQRPTFDLLMVF